ncbi:FHA domain-containing protein [Buchananella hordeovulneris]|nr:FHA domain-containing protein [Buchananella hordeovulneris]
MTAEGLSMTTPHLTVRPGGGLVASYPGGVMLLGPGSWSSARRIWSRLEQGIDPHKAVEDGQDVLIISNDGERRFLYRRGNIAVDASQSYDMVEIAWEEDSGGWYGAFVPATAEIEASVDGPCYRGLLPLTSGMATAFSIRLAGVKNTNDDAPAPKVAAHASDTPPPASPKKATVVEEAPRPEPAALPGPVLEPVESPESQPYSTDALAGLDDAKTEALSVPLHVLPDVNDQSFAFSADLPAPVGHEPIVDLPTVPYTANPDDTIAQLPGEHFGNLTPPNSPDMEDRTLTQEQYQALVGDGPVSNAATPVLPGAGPAVDLVVSTGHRIALERSAVLGREPRSDVYGVGTNPHMVALPSPAGEISRVHAAFVRHGSGFAVVDLGAANGTSVLRSGVSHKLVAHTPLLLEQGDIVDIGEGVTAWLEPRL